MIKNMKRHLAMFLAAAVVVTGIPVMTADAATVTYYVDGKEAGTADVTTVSGAEAKQPEVTVSGCETVEWNYDGISDETLSGNESVSINGTKVKKHTGDTEEKTTKEATCGAEGSKEIICKNCKDVLKVETIPATGKHTWDEGKETTPATTEKEGVKTFTCKVCGKTKTEPIAKLAKEEVKPTLKLNAKSITLQVKKSTTAVKASGMVKGDKVVSWTSSNKKVVTVTNKGKITAKKVGKATITVKTKLGATAKLTVKVQKGAVKLKKISVDKKKVTLTAGKSATLVVTKSPITAQDKVTFKTSNKKVATVSKSGKITAKKAGNATITVKAGKKTAKVKVTVKKASKKK